MKDLNQVVKDLLLQKAVPFLTKYVVRWSIKFVGSVLVYLGYTQTQYEQFVSGLVLFVVGILWTLFTDKVLGKKDTLP